jgi:spore coat protein SA
MLIRRYLRRNAHQIISVSDALRLAFAANGISNVRTIHNGIDPEDMQVAAGHVQDFIRRFNLTDKKAILFGGRLSYLKGAVHLLRAFSNVAARVPEAVLLIIGNRAGYGRDIATEAQNLGIAARVVFTGWIDGDVLRSAYAACSVAVVPSICFDSFPVVNLEAMAASRPVIATCFGGSREVVADGQTGYIVNPLNTAVLAERIMDILANDEKGRLMGATGYRRIQERFSLAHCAQAYLDLVKHVGGR